MFQDVHQALSFAYSIPFRSCNNSTAFRLTPDEVACYRGRPRGESLYDGVAQAAMVKRIVELTLTPVELAYVSCYFGYDGSRLSDLVVEFSPEGEERLHAALLVYILLDPARQLCLGRDIVHKQPYSERTVKRRLKKLRVNLDDLRLNILEKLSKPLAHLIKVQNAA